MIGYIITTYCGLNIYWIYYKTFYFYLWTFIVKVMPLIISICLMLFSQISAEEGEIQINIGGGGFFPLSLKTDDETVIVYSSWNVGLNT